MSFGVPFIGFSDLQMGSPCVPNASSSREQVDFVGKFDRGTGNFNPYSNTYNQGRRHHPNMSYANNSNVLNPPPMTQQVSRQPPVHQQHSFQQKGKDKDDMSEFKKEMKDMMQEMMRTLTQNVVQSQTSQGAIINDLQRQVAQLSEAVNTHPNGTLPSNTEKNPKEEVKVITLRSGRELKEGIREMSK